MLELFFGHHAGWFTAPALIGTAFFVIRLLAISAGFDHTLHDTSAPPPIGDHHPDPVHGFKFISLQGALAFMMGFGWGGLGAMRGAGWSIPASTLTGLLCGVAMVWLLCLLLKGIHDLQSSGNLSILSTHGAAGDVY